MFTKALALLLPAFVAGQAYGPPVGPASPSSTTTSAALAPSAPPSTATQINVDVAVNQTFRFNPSSIVASPGTNVTFYFPNFGLSHSVTQSTFANPCTYLSPNTTANTPGGFDSSLLQASTFTLTVTDMNPVWFFCKQVTHCGLGMVGSINPPTNGTNTFQAYQAAAIAIGNANNETTTPDNGTPSLSGVDATPVGSPVPDISGAAATPSGAIRVTSSIGLVLFAAVLGFAMV